MVGLVEIGHWEHNSGVFASLFASYLSQSEQPQSDIPPVQMPCLTTGSESMDPRNIY